MVIRSGKMSRDERIKTVFLIAAFVILMAILVGGHNKGRGPVQLAKTVGEKTIVPKKTERSRKGRVEKVKPLEIEMLLHEVGREDPFLPSGDGYMSGTPEAAPLNLTGIVKSDGKSLAIINDMLVGEGDKIEGETVIKIGKEDVVMEKNGKTHVLRLSVFEYQKKGGK